jgi:hypothetical protein
MNRHRPPSAPPNPDLDSTLLVYRSIPQNLLLVYYCWRNFCPELTILVYVELNVMYCEILEAYDQEHSYGAFKTTI